MARPAVSFVVPAEPAGDGVAATLRSIARQAGVHVQEVVVVVGAGDDDAAQAARNHGAGVVEQAAGGVGSARHLGAVHATGDYLAFVDAGIVLRPAYAARLLDFAADAGVAAASTRCRLGDSWRAKPREWTVNYVYPRLDPPVLPGFNTFVDRAAYLDSGGFPDVPNESAAFSRRFGREYDTAFCPAVLATTPDEASADDRPALESPRGASPAKRLRADE